MLGICVREPEMQLPTKQARHQATKKAVLRWLSIQLVSDCIVLQSQSHPLLPIHFCCGTLRSTSTQLETRLFLPHSCQEMITSTVFFANICSLSHTRLNLSLASSNSTAQLWFSLMRLCRRLKHWIRRSCSSKRSAPYRAKHSSCTLPKAILPQCIFWQPPLQPTGNTLKSI